MAYWGTPKSNQMYSSKGFDETDFVMGVMLSQKPGNDLIQNCDLPPPTKVFSGLSDNGAIISSPLNRKKLHSLVGDEDDVGLLKALRLSQTRAREAEAKCAAIIKDRDALALAFVQDSMQIFAYRQFVRLLECQVSQFQKQKTCCNCGNISKREETEEEEEEEDIDDGNGNNNNGFTFFMTLAFCLGVAGVGLAIGCTFLYSN